MAKVIALSFVTTVGLQESDLLDCFHALSDYAMLEITAHVDHCVDDGSVVRVSIDSVHKGLIYLQSVNRKLSQIA